MTEEATPAKVRLTDGLGPLPAPWADASPVYYLSTPVTSADPRPMWPALYTADQMRAYASAAVAAERERCARIVEREVFKACPHLRESEFAALIRSGA